MSRSLDKVVGLEELAETVRRLKERSRTVAMCHGCFDILHFGHIRHLEAAKKMADVLVVTVTPDRFINKGANRPVFPEHQRAEVVAGLSAVDWVAINYWDSAVETIRLVRPDLFVKGQEYESRAQEVNPNYFAEVKAIDEIGGKIAFTYESTSSSTVAFRRLTAVSR